MAPAFETELTSPMATLCSPRGWGWGHTLCPDNPFSTHFYPPLRTSSLAKAVGTSLRCTSIHVPTGCSILTQRTQTRVQTRKEFAEPPPPHPHPQPRFCTKKVQLAEATSLWETSPGPASQEKDMMDARKDKRRSTSSEEFCRAQLCAPTWGGGGLNQIHKAPSSTKQKLDPVKGAICGASLF